MIEFDPDGHIVYDDVSYEEIGYIDPLGVIRLSDSIEKLMPRDILVYEDTLSLLEDHDYSIKDRLGLHSKRVKIQQENPLPLLFNDWNIYDYEGSRIGEYLIDAILFTFKRSVIPFLEQSHFDFLIPGMGVDGNIIIDRENSTFATQGYLEYFLHFLYVDVHRFQYPNFAEIQMAVDKEYLLYSEELFFQEDSSRLEIFRRFIESID